MLRSHVTLLILTLALSPLSTAALELDESPAEAGSWGFRPAPDHEPQTNPPAFSWRIQPEAQAYALEVAKDDAFTEIVYAVEATPWSAHVSDIPLTPGAYYWRYAILDASGEASGWSQTRPFRITEGLPRFPKPPLAELLRRIPEKHPRLYFRPEEIEPLQTLAKNSLADRWTALLSTAEALLAKPPDTSEPPLYPESITSRDAEWKRIWWGNRTRGIAMMDAAATLAFVYRLGGDERHGKAARDLLMAFTQWDPAGSTNWKYNDEAAMPLLYYPARAYTWAYDALSEDDRARIIAVMRQRGLDCFNHLQQTQHLWRPYSSHSNRAWHWLGEMAIAFHDEIPEAPLWLDFAVTKFFVCYPVWGAADGGWHEGTAYWLSYLDRFMYWVFVSQAAFGINPFDKPFFSETGYYGIYTMPPGAQAGAFGDQGILVASKNAALLLAKLAAGANNGHWQWYAGQHQVEVDGYFGFLFAMKAARVEARAPEDLPSSRAFPGTGLAVLNTNLIDGTKNIQIHFKSSPFGRQSHGYNANNAFLLYLHGQPALIRSGRREVHGSPHHRQWMWETKSDNAILVNGQGQLLHSPLATGAITVFDTSDTLDVVAGEAAASYPGRLDRWCRRILFFKPGVILIHDLLRAPEPSDYQWLLHSKGSFTLGDNAAAWAGEAGSVDVQFLLPESLNITQTDLFDPPPAEWSNLRLGEWHLSANTTGKSTETDFVTLLRVNATEAEAAVAKKDSSIEATLRLPEGEFKITLEEDSFSVLGPGTAKTY